MNLSRFLKQHFLVVIVALAILLVISWHGIKVRTDSSEIDRDYGVTQADDAKTGERLGVVILERRDPRTKKVVSYRIRRPDGSVIERPADSVWAFDL